MAGRAQQEHLPQTKSLPTTDAQRQWLLPAARRQTGRKRTKHWRLDGMKAFVKTSAGAAQAVVKR